MNPDDRTQTGLSTPDAQALDALVDAGLDPAAVPEPLRARAARAASLLRLLDGPRPPGNLVERTCAAIRSADSTHELTLCRDDALALEALAAAGFDESKVGQAHRERASLHARLARVAAQTPAPGLGSSDLARRAFDLVMVAAERPAPLPFRLAEGEPRVRRINYFDLVGVAAMLLLGVSVIWPVFSAVQQRQARNGCLANLGAVAAAMTAYAGANRDALPVASASAGRTWWEVGNPPNSNSANLFTLARTRYAKVDDLACPANSRAASATPPPGAMDWSDIRDPSYSYQIMFGATRPRWNGPSRVVVLADRSPIILRNLRRQLADPMENSPNHCQRGQDVLFSDGSAQWLTTPELPSGDNIWLPRKVENMIRDAQGRDLLRLNGDETPGSDQDAFVGP